MAKYSWSEVFMSIEGEGPYSGWPTVYIRFTGCNFECRGFNNPEGLDTSKKETLGFDPKDYNNIYDIPLITKGCDSIYSVHRSFAHMWTQGSTDELAQLVMDTLPHGQWNNPMSGRPVILSLTGGEPTLRAKHIPELLNHPLFKELSMVLIETNAAVPLQDSFIDGLANWLDREDKIIIWSNSPKLSISGEKWEDAIRPDIITKQLSILERHPKGGVIQYFKFVCGPNDKDFDEVASAMNMYYEAGIDPTSSVFVMPAACQESDQNDSAAEVANLCIQRGYIYCHRVHLNVYGNGVGT